MSQKLSWGEIKDRYPDEWVELIEYEWDESEPKPRSGVVRDHAKNRRELHERFLSSPVDDSAIVYTGPIIVPEGSIFSANLHQYSIRR